MFKTTLEQLVRKCDEPETPFINRVKFNPRMDNYHIHCKVWDEISFAFTNYNGRAVEVWEWISNFIPHFAGHVIIYPFLGLMLNHVSSRGHWSINYSMEL